MHKIHHESDLGPVRLTLHCETDSEEDAALARKVLALAVKMLQGPTFAEMSGIKKEKPCGCSGS